MKPAVAFGSLTLALLPITSAAADLPPPPQVGRDAQWTEAQSAYLAGRWAWSTPIAVNMQPASGTIDFAADGGYVADMARGRWTLKAIAEGLFEVTLTGSSGAPRRLVFRMIDATTMHSEAENLTYLKVR